MMDNISFTLSLIETPEYRIVFVDSDNNIIHGIKVDAYTNEGLAYLYEQLKEGVKNTTSESNEK